MTNVPGLIDEVKSVEPERFKSSQRKIEASSMPADYVGRFSGTGNAVPACCGDSG